METMSETLRLGGQRPAPHQGGGRQGKPHLGGRSLDEDVLQTGGGPKGIDTSGYFYEKYWVPLPLAYIYIQIIYPLKVRVTAIAAITRPAKMIRRRTRRTTITNIVPNRASNANQNSNQNALVTKPVIIAG